MKDLTTMTVKELKEMAKEMKISNWWNLKKETLIEKITLASQEDDIQTEVEEDNNYITEETNVEESAPETSEKKPRGKLIEYKGKAQTLNAWAEELGFAPQTLFARLYMSNWPAEKAFETPSRRKSKDND